MTISRVPEGEPKRWKNGCLSVLARLVILFFVLVAMLYVVLKYGPADFLYGPHVRR